MKLIMMRISQQLSMRLLAVSPLCQTSQVPESKRKILECQISLDNPSLFILFRIHRQVGKQFAATCREVETVKTMRKNHATAKIH